MELLNSISHQPDIDKKYLYFKDPYEAKYQLLTNTRKSEGLKHCHDPSSYTECSNNMTDIFENIVEYSPNKKCKMMTIFDDMITDMLSNKRLDSIVTGLFIRARKLNISIDFITQPYLA